MKLELTHKESGFLRYLRSLREIEIEKLIEELDDSANRYTKAYIALEDSLNNIGSTAEEREIREKFDNMRSDLSNVVGLKRALEKYLEDED